MRPTLLFPVLRAFRVASPSAVSKQSLTVVCRRLNSTWCRREGLRNVAVIAHVDHGKTSLTERLLQASKSGTLSSQDSTMNNLTMDSGDLEKERGITIQSKVTRITHRSGECIINVADTPGHVDFSGEVDRFLTLSDGFLLVVDAAEGPKSQTKYVLSRALRMDLTPIVVLNKCDRADAAAKIDSGETESQILDLFDSLGATDEQMDYTTLYASAKQGWVTLDPIEALELAEKGYDGSDKYSASNLLDYIVEHVPEPLVTSYASNVESGTKQQPETFADDAFSLVVVTVGRDQFLGRTCMGRIVSGSVATGDSVSFIKRLSEESGAAKTLSSENVTGMFVNEGVSRIPFESRAYAGDIVTITGVPDDIAVGDTLTASKNPVDEPISTPPLAPPTLVMEFGANDGPLAGAEGTILASSKVRSRLMFETDNNVTLKCEPSPTDSEKTVVYARGELQLGILVEQMRREGFEMVISPPRILTSTCPETGEVMEPFEEVIVDVDAEYSGAVVSSLTGDRKGILVEMTESAADGKCRLVLEVPSRGLLGFNSEIASATKGSAVVNHLYLEDRKHAGSLGTGLEKGKLVSNSGGKATTYSLSSILARGTLFIEAGDDLYEGMVIGESSRAGDLEVNAVRAKEKTNIRTVAKDEKVFLPPPKRQSVEELIGYMGPDELIEVTPKSVRLRKALLDSSARERAQRTKAKQLRAAKEKK